MKSHGITGGGSVPLHVLETGNPLARPILSSMAFRNVRCPGTASLSRILRSISDLFAIDLRGHGRSDKPRALYSDSKLWADD
jgi:pimeloyl-ACP methyl ester carboxylesterase